MLEDRISFRVVGPIVTTAAGTGPACCCGSARTVGDRRGPAARKIWGCAQLRGWRCTWLRGWSTLGLPAFTEMAVKLGIVVLALLLVRCAIQMALLHEQPGSLDRSTGAVRALSDGRAGYAVLLVLRSRDEGVVRTSRRHLRESPPVPVPA